jgi:hypothetical protein
MSELPTYPPPPPPQFDPELEAAIRWNVSLYWNAEVPYDERLQAQAALQSLAVEGFRELLHVVDMLRSTLRNRRTVGPEPVLIKERSLIRDSMFVQAPFPEGFWDGLGKGKGSS